MTPIIGLWLTGLISACAILTVVIVSAFPVSPPPLLDTAKISSDGVRVQYALEEGQYGANCAIGTTIHASGGVVTGQDPRVSCSMPRKAWHQVVGEAAAVAFGPFVGLFLMLLRWMLDKSRRGRELPGRRRIAVDVTLAALGVALFAASLNGEVTILAQKEGETWVSSYADPSWGSEFMNYVSDIGLGLFLGAAVAFCVSHIEARVSRFLTEA